MKLSLILHVLVLCLVHHGSSERVTERLKYTEKGNKLEIRQSSFKKVTNRNFKSSHNYVILQQIHEEATLVKCAAACQDNEACLGFLFNRTQSCCSLLDHLVDINQLEHYNGTDYYEIKVNRYIKLFMEMVQKKNIPMSRLFCLTVSVSGPHCLIVKRA